MTDLSKKKCVACDGNIPPFDTSEIHKYLKKVDAQMPIYKSTKQKVPWPTSILVSIN